MKPQKITKKYHLYFQMIPLAKVSKVLLMVVPVNLIHSVVFTVPLVVIIKLLSIQQKLSTSKFNLKNNLLVPILGLFSLAKSMKKLM